MFNLSYIRSIDTETYRFSPGRMAPKMVCASTASIIEAELFIGQRAIDLFRLLDSHVIATANGAFDLAVAANADPTLLPIVFRALREGRVYDVLIGEALNAIYGGHLGLNPNGSELRKPDGKVTNRYSLEIVTRLVTGRTDAKKNDVFRKSYALLDGIDQSLWPEEAREYPKDDARNTLKSAVGQIFGVPGNHAWVDFPAIPGIVAAATKCRYCDEEFTLVTRTGETCARAPRRPHKNLGNMSAQVEADFAAKLGACHGLRTDPEKIAQLEEKVEGKHRVFVERFKKLGWIRDDDTEDQAAVKRAIALAYGATGTCKRCGGTGKVRSVKKVECRGEKVRGRFQGCAGDVCGECTGTRLADKIGNEVTCKNVYDEDDDTIEVGCDGTGLDLSSAPMLPRTKNKEHPRRLGGVATDRDTAMESGDEDVADYGENEHEKSRNTYLPYLKTGIDAPLVYSPNVLVESGRYSYEGSPMHQMPRAGLERQCIRARGAWCGYPIEMVLGSTDYSAGELCTNAQYTYWLFGYSQMREAINRSGDPGILHSELAAEVMGIPIDDFLARLKAKDKQAVDFRQASKPMNFGKPAAMGSPKIVATNRKKNAGFTPCEGGPARDAKGREGYWGIRFCILVGGEKRCGEQKIMEWKKHPCAPVCKKCVEIEANILSPAYFRRFPEIKDLHKWAAKKADAGAPAPCAVWDADAGAPKIVRLRGGCDFSAFCNNGFQAMLSDIMKDAYVNATREAYLGVKDDGSPSPLFNCRLPLVIHDEPLSELIADTAHLSGPRIAEIMIASGKKLAPDVAWVAETALMRYWYKAAEPVYKDGKLIPWEPGT